MLKIFAGIAVLATVLVAVLLFNQTSESSSLPEIVQIPQNQTSPNSSPIPFAEMTIPALRERKWESNLTELKPYSQNGSYNSYLTSYKSDGFSINGLLTRPTGPMPEGGWPAVVFVHGYIAPSIYKTTERYQDHINYLSRNGLVVFKIDLRGHGDSEGEAYGGYYSGDYIVDTLNAVAALKNSDFVHDRKIGMWGHSMAGNVLLRAFAVKPDIPAVVIWGGAGFTYTDLQTFGIDDNSYRPPNDNSERQRRREALRAAHGDFDPKSDFWKQVTPVNYLQDLKGAIALHHAEDDTVVNIEYSRNLNKLLDQTNVIHQFFEYRTGGHNITGSSFNSAIQRTVDFYKKYL